VEFEGTRMILLEFYAGESFVQQAVQALDQLQDVVVETILQPWPPCPSHEHVMVPVALSGKPTWLCPEDDHIAIPVGALVDH
jgi:hypothetical protein